ncbi:nicotinate-nucleotide adenylyltransferase [Desulfoluna spongiiphila]|uniref:Probable nicotinate-nucleotide adenylyltransferase n=2 Tax=Desulfoluna spongiiphila TaxID=419481 RepID=A0A1G5I833_9BACT|nr:nicotinate-nucleotide adenylyltransferase [Desulfoluna spongiiphila]
MGMEETKEQSRTGQVVIFGGTFNPVHLAHAHVVKEILRLIVPDRLYVVPAAVPPHKQGRNIVSAEHRVAMLERAMEGLPVVLSDVELKREGKSFTVDTLRALRKEVAGDAELYLTMGVDAFFDFHTWRDEKLILSMAGIIVVNRPGTPHGDLPVEELQGYLTDHIDSGYSWDPERKRFVHPSLCGIVPLSVTPVSPLSSTDVRTCIEQGDRPTDLLHPEVLRYIEDKGLYR